MGKVLIPIIVENSTDLDNAEKGLIKPSEVRKLELEALVDTGAELLCLDSSIIQQLGLRQNGKIKVKRFGPAYLTILGRTCSKDILEINNPRYKAIVGYLALEELHLIVDPKAQKVILNPQDADEMLIDMV